MTKLCKHCNAVNDEQDKFCGECGHQFDLLKSSSCIQCSGDEDGFCMVCGKRLFTTETSRIAREQQNKLIVSDCLGMITDMGKRHKINEDYGQVIVHGDETIMIVCDGVSTSWKGHLASKKATQVAMDYLVSNTESCDVRIKNAILRAHHAVQKIGKSPNSSETTIVVLVKNSDQCTVGWVGDSRLYEIGKDKVSQITVDDSWIEEMLKNGKTYEAAKSDKLAHAITQTLGMDDEPNVNVKQFVSSDDLLICSDGLWNYLETTDEIFSFYDVLRGEEIENVLTKFINYANENGGVDNITLGLLKNTV